MADSAAGVVYTPEQLEIGNVYTRDDLRAQFDITDATLNTGIFKPKGTQSVWIFVTEKKTADRTQYHDRIEGDLLYCQGQTSGRKDRLYIDQKALGLELLVFYRTKKYEHPGAGFRYLGPFDYVSHSGREPTDFVLKRRSAVNAITAGEADEDPYDPADIEDTRKKVMRAIKARRGQKQFRDSLIAAYEGKCAITGCDVLDVLEAAHIDPYKGEASNHVSNGILLRADLHTLFDCGLIKIDPETMTVVVDPKIAHSSYARFDGKKMSVPASYNHKPSNQAVAARGLAPIAEE